MTRNTKRLAAMIVAAAMIGFGTAGCHVGVSVHNKPGGVTVTKQPSSSPSH